MNEKMVRSEREEPDLVVAVVACCDLSFTLKRGTSRQLGAEERFGLIWNLRVSVWLLC